MIEGVNSTMIHYKNFCWYHNIPQYNSNKKYLFVSVHALDSPSSLFAQATGSIEAIDPVNHITPANSAKYYACEWWQMTSQPPRKA
jgi:hypothetical protein